MTTTAMKAEEALQKQAWKTLKMLRASMPADFEEVGTLRRTAGGWELSYSEEFAVDLPYIEGPKLFCMIINEPDNEAADSGVGLPLARLATGSGI